MCPHPLVALLVLLLACGNTPPRTEGVTLPVAGPSASASSSDDSHPRLRYPVGDPRNATYEGAGCATDLGGCTNGLTCCVSDPRDFGGICQKVCPPMKPRAPVP